MPLRESNFVRGWNDLGPLRLPITTTRSYDFRTGVVRGLLRSSLLRAQYAGCQAS
jgi:hypothetical protein